jgi:hypothetical protein
MFLQGKQYWQIRVMLLIQIAGRLLQIPVCVRGGRARPLNFNTSALHKQSWTGCVCFLCALESSWVQVWVQAQRVSLSPGLPVGILGEGLPFWGGGCSSLLQCLSPSRHLAWPSKREQQAALTGRGLGDLFFLYSMFCAEKPDWLHARTKSVWCLKAPSLLSLNRAIEYHKVEEILDNGT